MIVKKNYTVDSIFSSWGHRYLQHDVYFLWKNSVSWQVEMGYLKQVTHYFKSAYNIQYSFSILMSNAVVEKNHCHG